MDRNLAVLSLFSALITFASTLFSTVFNIYLWDRGFSLLDIAVLSAVSTFMSLIFSRFFGVLADSVRRKPFIILQSVVMSLAYFGFYIALEMPNLSILSLELLYALLGFAGAIGTGAYLAAMTTSLSRINTGRATGIYLSFSMLGGALGSLLSGYIAEEISIYLDFIIAALAALMGGIIIYIWYYENGNGLAKTYRYLLKQVLRQAMQRKLRGDRSLLAVFMTIVVVISIANSIYFLAFSIKLYVLLGSKTLFGIVNCLSNLVGIVFPYFIGILGDRIGKEKLLIIGISTRDILMLYLAFAWDSIAAVVFWVLPFWPLIYISLLSLTTEYSEIGAESELQAIRNVIASASSTIGYVIGGLIADSINLNTNIYNIYAVLIVGVFFYFVASLLGIVLLRRKNGSALILGHLPAEKIYYPTSPPKKQIQ